MKDFLVLALALLFSISVQSQGIRSLRAEYDFNLPSKLHKPAGPPLEAGTYTVGNSGYFTTIQAAFDKLSTDGIEGSITLELIDDLYISPNDSLGFILIGPIPGSSKDNRVTVRPAGNKNVLIEGEGQSVLSLGNTSFVTFDGINTTGPTTMTVHAMNNNTYIWNATIDFWNDSDHDVIQNIVFVNDDLDGVGSGPAFWVRKGSIAVPDSNIIQNNFIKKAGVSIDIEAFNTPVKASGNIIRNNRIGSETDSLIWHGIFTYNNYNTIIENNIIQNIRYLNPDWDNVGIDSEYDENCIIRNNIVHNICAIMGSYAGCGITLWGGKNNLVYNNIIYDISGLAQGVSGLFVREESNTKFFFNTIYLTGDGKGENFYGSDALTVEYNCKNIEIKNNILINMRNESPYSASSLRIVRTTLNAIHSDFNVLYCQPSDYNYISKYELGYKCRTLEEWQLTGNDLNSYSFIPYFADENLHIDPTLPSFIESGGFPIPLINYDIDGDLRHPYKPDIGADEFNGIQPQEALLIKPDQVDFGNLNCSQISDTISVKIKNRNQDPIEILSITNKKTEFKLVNLPTLPSLVLPNDSLIFYLYFNPLSVGTFTDEIVVLSNDHYKPKYNISLKGNVSSFGLVFQSFFDNVNAASTNEEKNLLVENFLNTHPVLPLIEDSIAIFIYKGEANCVSVVSDFNYWTDNVCPMYRISGTDLWFRAHTFEMDARIDYKYCINHTDWIVDERNPRFAPSAFGSNSELAMPEYVDAPEIEYYTDIPHGFTYYKTITSTNLGNTRTVYIYTPPGYNPEGSETYPIILFHDGGDFINLAKVNNVFDYLIDKKKIQPLIGVFVPPVERDAEYADDKRFLYEAFIIDELMPFIDSTYHTKKDPKSRAMLGISFGGLITTQICYNHPESFGLAAPFSASYRASGMSVYNSVLNGPKKEIKWCIDWGKYEPTIVITSVKLRDSLINKGYDLIWNEWHEGHSWGSWRAHLDNALEYFFPANAVRIEEENALTPGYYFLGQNYPNPFNPSTTFRYSIPTQSKAIIKIYDIIGREVVTLVNGEKQTGTYELTWYAEQMPSGVYFYQLRAGGFVETKKMILIR